MIYSYLFRILASKKFNSQIKTCHLISNIDIDSDYCIEYLIYNLFSDIEISESLNEKQYVDKNLKNKELQLNVNLKKNQGVELINNYYDTKLKKTFLTQEKNEKFQILNKNCKDHSNHHNKFKCELNHLCIKITDLLIKTENKKNHKKVKNAYCLLNFLFEYDAYICYVCLFVKSFLLDVLCFNAEKIKIKNRYLKVENVFYCCTNEKSDSLSFYSVDKHLQCIKTTEEKFTNFYNKNSQDYNLLINHFDFFAYDLGLNFISSYDAYKIKRFKEFKNIDSFRKKRYESINFVMENLFKNEIFLFEKVSKIYYTINYNLLYRYKNNYECLKIGIIDFYSFNNLRIGNRKIFEIDEIDDFKYIQEKNPTIVFNIYYQEFIFDDIETQKTYEESLSKFIFFNRKKCFFKITENFIDEIRNDGDSKKINYNEEHILNFFSFFDEFGFLKCSEFISERKSKIEALCDFFDKKKIRIFIKKANFNLLSDNCRSIYEERYEIFVQNIIVGYIDLIKLKNDFKYVERFITVLLYNISGSFMYDCIYIDDNNLSELDTKILNLKKQLSNCNFHFYISENLFNKFKTLLFSLNKTLSECDLLEIESRKILRIKNTLLELLKNNSTLEERINVKLFEKILLKKMYENPDFNLKSNNWNFENQKFITKIKEQGNLEIFKVSFYFENDLYKFKAVLKIIMNL